MFRKNVIAALVMVTALAGTGAEVRAQGVTRDATGVVTASRTVTLSVKITARISELGIEEGDTVAKGQALAIMDAAELEADLASARAALGLAEVELEHAGKVEARIARLYKKKSASEDALDEARYGTRAARERVRSAEADVARAESILRETRLLAPFDAVVIEKHAEVGQLTRPGEPLFVLEDHGTLKFRTRVKEREIPQIELGQQVVVTIDALDDARLEAKVTKIIPSGDESHTFVVEATLPPTSKLYPGMFGKASFPR